MPFGYWVVRLFKARRHPRRSAAATSGRRTSGGRTGAGSGSRSCCSTSSRASCRRSWGRCSSRTGSGSPPAPPRWSGTGGRSSSASRRAGRRSRPTAAPSSASPRPPRHAGSPSGCVVFVTLRYASVASMVAAASLPLLAYVFGDAVAGGRLRGRGGGRGRRPAPAEHRQALPRDREPLPAAADARGVLAREPVAQLGVPLRRRRRSRARRAAPRRCPCAPRRRRGCGSSRG